MDFQLSQNLRQLHLTVRHTQVEHYNLDMILSVGYRVKSKEGIYSRRWANSVLKQHLVDGYTINHKRA